MSAEIASPKHSPGGRWWAISGALLLIAYELLWVAPWHQALRGFASAPPLAWALGVLGAVHGGAFALAAGMERLRLVRKVQLGVLVGFLAVALLAGNAALTTSPDGFLTAFFTLQLETLFTTAFIVYLWWRGFTLAYDGIRPNTVWARFRVGLAGFMAYIFYAYQWSVAPPGLAWYLGFLFAGLLAVILTRIAFVWTSRGSRRNPFDRRWLAAMLAALAGVLLIAGLLGSLLSGQYRMIIDFLSRLATLLWTALLFLLALPALLFSFLIYPLVAWLQSLMANAKPYEAPEIAAPSLYPYPYPIENSGPPAWLQYGGTVIFWAIMLAFAAWLLLRARRAIVTRALSEAEEPEFLLGKGEAARLLRQSLRDGWDDLLARLRPAPKWQPPQRVRQIYIALLALASERGHPRQPWQTPREFLPEARQAFPGREAEVETITRAYEPVRYGGEAGEDVEDAWERLSVDKERL